METPQRFGTGAIPTPPELLRRLAAISPRASSLVGAGEAPPAVVDLSPLLSPVKNQSSYDACAAFACCAATEFVPFNLREGQNESERFVWYNAKANDNLRNPTANRGTIISVALSQLMRLGSCWESACPTAPDPLAPPPQSAYTQASNMKVTNALRVQPNTPEGIKFILRFGWPVIIGFRIAPNTLASTSTGVIQVPNPRELTGGHAVLIVGYDDNKRLFKFKNSYGSDWGQQGYGFMPYAYIGDTYTFDLFTIQGQEYVPESGRVGPSRVGPSCKVTVGPSAEFLSQVEISDGLQPGDIDWAKEMAAGPKEVSSAT